MGFVSADHVRVISKRSCASKFVDGKLIQFIADTQIIIHLVAAKQIVQIVILTEKIWMADGKNWQNFLVCEVFKRVRACLWVAKILDDALRPLPEHQDCASHQDKPTWKPKPPHCFVYRSWTTLAFWLRIVITCKLWQIIESCFEA